MSPRVLVLFALAYVALGVFAGVATHSWTTGIGVALAAPLGAFIGIRLAMLGAK